MVNNHKQIANQVVVDLDNWLFNVDNKIVGFVMDVLGKVEHPYYIVKS